MSPPSERSGRRAANSRDRSQRSWRERLDDPAEPLFTVGVVAELLELDPQSLRRLEFVLPNRSARPSGNQRRYARTDIEVLAAAAELAAEGLAPAAITRILELQHQLDATWDQA